MSQPAGRTRPSTRADRRHASTRGPCALSRRVLALPRLVLALPRRVLALPRRVLALPRRVLALPRRVLALPRLGLALLASVLLWSGWGLCALLLRRARRERARRAIVRAWGRALLRAFRVQLVLEGQPPRAGLVVANHSSYLDVLVLCAACGARFVAAAELGRWPLFGPMARSAGTLLLERERKRALLPVGAELERALAAGELVVLFPEGRSTRGERVLPFRASLLEAAARSGAPVHAASVHYASAAGEAPAGELVPWTDGAPFLPHALRLAAGAGQRARLRFGHALRGAERKALAREAERAVGELFEPLAGAGATSSVARSRRPPRNGVPR